MRYKHYLQILTQKLLKPVVHERLHMLHIDQNGLYGTNGTISILDIGEARYCYKNREEGMRHSYWNSLWKISWEQHSFVGLVF